MNSSNCDCTGENANIINSLMQNPNNNISGIGNMGMNNMQMNNGMQMNNNMQMNNGMQMNNMPLSSNDMPIELSNLNNFGNVGNNVQKGTSVNAIRNISNNNNNSVRNNNIVRNNSNKNVIDNVSNHVAKDLTQIIDNTYLNSLQNINLGFMLASALAWHEAVKYFIMRSIKFNRGQPMYYIYYALLVTVVAAFMLTITKKYFNNKLQDPKITYAVTV